MARRRRPCCTLERAACITAVRCAAAQGSRRQRIGVVAPSNEGPMVLGLGVDRPRSNVWSPLLARRRRPCCTLERAACITAVRCAAAQGSRRQRIGVVAPSNEGAHGPRTGRGDRLRPVSRRPTIGRRRLHRARSDPRTPRDRPSLASTSPTVWRTRSSSTRSDRAPDCGPHVAHVPSRPLF